MQAVGRVQDSAAPGRDFLIGKTFDLIQELSVPASGVDDVRMAVAEGRQDQTAAAVQDFGRFRHGASHLPESRDTAVFHQQPGVFQRTGRIHFSALFAQDPFRNDAGQRCDVGQELTHGLEILFLFDEPDGRFNERMHIGVVLNERNLFPEIAENPFKQRRRV